MKELTISAIEDLEQLAALNIAQKIILKCGKYTIDKPIKLKSITNKLIIDGQNSQISATALVTSQWLPYNADIYFTVIPKGLDIQCVYVNNTNYIMARCPNYAEGEILGGVSKHCLDKERVATWQHPQTGYLRAIHINEWGGNSYKIIGKNVNNTLKLQWIGDNNRGSEYHSDKVMVENIFEELDCPREWFYDKDSGKLYIFPMQSIEMRGIEMRGIDLNDCRVEYGVCSGFFNLENCSDVEISNFSFVKSNRTMFNSEYTKVTRSDWAIAPKGAIYLENCKDLVLSNIKFDNVGSNCIFINKKNSNIIIKDCEFTNCGASGVAVFGNQNACRDLSTWENHKTTINDSQKGAKNDDYPIDIGIISCYFYNLGIYEKQSAPITISVANKVSVKGCTIHHVPRAGINICDGNFGGHIIEDNDIFDTVTETGDHGPINSWGRDRFWSLKKYNTLGKYGSIKKRFALLDAVEANVINHNRIVGTKGFGIDLDDGSSNYVISNNLCYGVGIKLREGFYRAVKNNILINAPIDLHATFFGNDDTIINNVVVAKKPLNVVFYNKGATTKMDNNIFVGAKTADLKKLKVFNTGKNYCKSLSLNEVMAMQYDCLANFNKFELKFGKTNAPQPVIENNIEEGLSSSLVYKHMLLQNINESIRSMAGLADYNGVFVCKIAFFSKFYKQGVRRGDTIIAINNTSIKNIEDLAAFEEKICAIKITRNQQTINL